MESPSELENATVIVLVLFASVLIAAYFVAMALGLTLFFSTQEGLAFSSHPITEVFSEGPYIFLLFIFGISFSSVNPNIGPLFLFLWSIYLLCFVAAWKLRESLHKVIKNSLSRPLSYTLRNNLFATPIITSMVLVAILLLNSIQESQGISAGQANLSGNPFAAFFELSYAPVVEEIGFRIVPIGAFLIVYLFLAGVGRAAAVSGGQRLKALFLSWLYPEKAKAMLGLKNVSNSGILRGISIPEWAAVVLTSAVFGWAHYYSGGGWEIGKVTLAFVQGFAMGLAYLLYGIQAPILIHWYFNYYSYTYWLASQPEFYPATLPLVGVFDLVTLALGVLGWITLVIGILHSRRQPERPTGEPVLPSLNFNEGS